MNKRLFLISFSLTLICFLLMLILVLTTTANAADATVSFSDLNLVGGQFWVYTFNGTLMGIYNTTDTGVLIPDQAIIVLKPAPTDFVKNPMQIPTLLLNLVNAFGSLIAIAAVVAFLLFMLWRGRR